MQEQAFRFGEGKHLVGIAGLPFPGGPEGTTGVIIVNMGMLYRAGPSRLHVTLSRQLNTCGYPTLRFDLSNLGDSDSGGGRLSRTEQVRADVVDAMDLLQRQAGCTRFVLFGLCSGAANIHEAIRHGDSRVVGAVFIDGYMYPTTGFRIRHYLPRLFSVRRIVHHLRLMRQPTRNDANFLFAVDLPPRSRVRQDYRHMLEQGLNLCFIFSGGISDDFNHPRQFRECFGRHVATHSGVSMHYFAHADHTFSLGCDREMLIDTIATWLQEAVPATAPVRTTGRAATP